MKSKPGNQKLWGGRFQHETSELVDTFNASVRFDWKLYPHDIQGSIAHARMLGEQGILKKSESRQIIQGLKQVLAEIESGKFQWSIAREDVHLNIEARLTEIVGKVGGKLHTGRSRNDQVATDLRLYCRDQVRKILGQLRDLQSAFLKLAEENVDVLLPGYTHLQRAQPISLAHYLLAFFEMLERDADRLQDSLARTNSLPLGAGALAGTTFPIDREMVARELGFDAICRNSLDAVSDRDFVMETLAGFSILMVHLSRLAEDWILWTSQEFQFIRLPEQFCTGSSMMPQKINPDVLELIRGKSARVQGDLHTLLTLMKGLPMTYNKDMQEDKEPLFDAVETVQTCLDILIAMLAKTKFNAEKMREALGAGFVLATDLADYLSTRGVPFREAHHIAGSIVAHCQEVGKTLEELTLEELRKFSDRFDSEIHRWLRQEFSVDRRQSLGGTGRKNVRREIKMAIRKLKRS